MLMGIGVCAISHQSRARVDARHTAALAIAEAGANYEINWLTTGHTVHVAASPGTGSLGTSPWNGSFSVIDKQTDGTAIANVNSPPTTIRIESTGTVDGVSRTVFITATSGGGAYDYAVYSKRSGVVNGTQSITGSVGTGGTITVNGANVISDKVIGLHGGTATATINPAGVYTTAARPTIDWPTTSQVADTKFGTNGLTYLSTHNDNNLASAFVNSGILNGAIKTGQTVTPAITATKGFAANGTGTLTLFGKTGGANYYLNSMTMNGTWNVVLNNTAGPINVWMVSPTGSLTSFTFNGGSASVTMDTDPAKACKMYLADNCNLTLNGNGTSRMGIYGISNLNTGGAVTFNGNNDLYGSVVTNSYTFNGTNAIHHVGGYFSAGSSAWTFGGFWKESNPR
jgi:hypothetical protein